MLVSSTVINARDLIAVEWALFIKAKGSTDQLLMVSVDRVNLAFLSKQPGFIKRELIKRSELEYADTIYWNTKKEAVTAVEKVFNCNEYFKLMDMEASANAGKGFSHNDILIKWH